MPRKKVKAENYPVTLSDWITFSESNASINTSLYVLIAGFIIAISVKFREINFDVVSIIFLIILFSGLMIGITGLLYASNRTKYYQKLSQLIMEGKIITPEEALEYYKTFRKEIKINN
jgi:hypothetical protein